LNSICPLKARLQKTVGVTARSITENFAEHVSYCPFHYGKLCRARSPPCDA
jgi:hypothetical protein